MFARTLALLALFAPALAPALARADAPVEIAAFNRALDAATRSMDKAAKEMWNP